MCPDPELRSKAGFPLLALMWLCLLPEKQQQGYW